MEIIWGKRLMLKHRYTDIICITAAVAACVLAVLFLSAEQLGIRAASSAPNIQEDCLMTVMYIHWISESGTGMHFLRLRQKKIIRNVMWRLTVRCSLP